MTLRRDGRRLRRRADGLHPDGTDPTAPARSRRARSPVSSTTQLRFRSYDIAGNAEAVHALTIDRRFDGARRPSCRATACRAASATNYPAPLDVSLAATDAGSGVAQIRYTTDGSTPTATTGTVYTGAFALGSSATLTYRAFDVAGNAEAPTRIALTVRDDPDGHDGADDRGNVLRRSVLRLAHRPRRP